MKVSQNADEYQGKDGVSCEICKRDIKVRM
jgi:hypothetical protein